jgi:hypothetical protein
MFGYEMPAKRSLVFSEATGENQEFIGNTAVTLVGEVYEENTPYAAFCDKQILSKFLKQQGCTHILIDVIDTYFIEEFGEMFSDNLQGWNLLDPTKVGNVYYKIEWNKYGMAVFVPV